MVQTTTTLLKTALVVGLATTVCSTLHLMLR